MAAVGAAGASADCASEDAVARAVEELEAVPAPPGHIRAMNAGAAALAACCR